MFSLNLKLPLLVCQMVIWGKHCPATGESQPKPNREVARHVARSPPEMHDPLLKLHFWSRASRKDFGDGLKGLQTGLAQLW